VRVSRFFWFLFTILLGATAGLVIGWYLSPAPMGDVSPSALRSDYRTDYVLMVAQVYEVEKSLSKANQRLEFLQGETPARLSQIAVLKAGELGYDRRDLELLARLAQAMLNVPGGPTPTAGVTP
jgi:hypothetical protein